MEVVEKKKRPLWNVTTALRKTILPILLTWLVMSWQVIWKVWQTKVSSFDYEERSGRDHSLIHSVAYKSKKEESKTISFYYPLMLKHLTYIIGTPTEKLDPSSI